MPLFAVARTHERTDSRAHGRVHTQVFNTYTYTATDVFILVGKYSNHWLAGKNSDLFNLFNVIGVCIPVLFIKLSGVSPFGTDRTRNIGFFTERKRGCVCVCVCVSIRMCVFVCMSECVGVSVSKHLPRRFV